MFMFKKRWTMLAIAWAWETMSNFINAMLLEKEGAGMCVWEDAQSV